MMHRFAAYLIFAMMCAVGGASAAPQLKSEQAIDRNIRQISERLRCPVCQSENLYDSKAPLANEMRQIIREQLLKGRTDDEIVSFFVARYGTFVLQAPPKEGSQLLLWYGPIFLVIFASLALAWHLRRDDDDENLVDDFDDDDSPEQIKESPST